ncbi:replication protein A1-like protein [Trifolium medium]|uniref:Replication protein A1-like protein n=1 Tax=Trifolium medium TaxID=97028 RepID=A0A392LWU2_9FABA|nr:replication protein A1-like protein [Trifolium medium]
MSIIKDSFSANSSPKVNPTRVGHDNHQNPSTLHPSHVDHGNYQNPSPFNASMANHQVDDHVNTLPAKYSHTDDPVRVDHGSLHNPSTVDASKATNRVDDPVNTCVHDFLALLQTYQMEFDSQSHVGRLPSCFTRELGDTISDLHDLYDVDFGAWIALTYGNPKLLTMRILTRWGVEYLPWYGFGLSAFAFIFSDVILVDNAGYQYRCALNFGVDAAGELSCNVSGGWSRLLARHGVVEGDRVKFSIDHYSASNVIVANRVHQLLKEPVDWNLAHRRVDYLDMVKVMYRTFQVECPRFEVVAKLPIMFTKEFASEMYRYNRVVDRYGNDFEDRYYRDLLVKHLYPSLRLNLSRTLFGSDKNPSWFDDVPLPYCHEPQNFAHNFIVILTGDDVHSGLLVINYGIFASKHFAKDAKCMALIDESGLEWTCTVKFSSHPFIIWKLVETGGPWLE